MNSNESNYLNWVVENAVREDWINSSKDLLSITEEKFSKELREEIIYADD